MGDIEVLLDLLKRLPGKARRVRVGIIEVEFAPESFATPGALKDMLEATAKNAYEAGRIESAIQRHDDDPLRLAKLADNLGVTPEELARATGRRPKVSDIASLARPVPEFDEDPMAAAEPAGAGLTDKARADFAAVTAPPADQGS